MILRRTAIAAALVSPFASSFAQGSNSWPDRAVKVVVGFPPGQTSDVIARLLSDALSKDLNASFFIDNKPGAGATLAAGLVAKAAKDGSTLLFSSSGPLTVAPSLYKNLPYDTFKEIEAVAFVGWSPLVLVVPASSPYHTISDLVQASKSGTKLFYGSGGNGVTNHLAMEMFKQTSGATFSHVPYKGAAPALTDLLGGNIHLMFETATPTMPLIAAGKLRPIATSTLVRYPELPNIPTVAETYPGFAAVPWAGFCVPTGTPVAIKRKLELAINKALADPMIRKKMLDNGFVAEQNMGAAKSLAFLKSESSKWKSVIDFAKIKVD